MTIDAREQSPAGHIVLTSEEYCALPDDGKRHEILDGEVYTTSSSIAIRVVEAFELGQGGYRRTARQTGAADIVPTLYAGLTIRLASLWS
jgi:hypothetical protein